MSAREGQETTRATVVHAVPGRLRVRIHAPAGQGKLYRLATELREMPAARTVRANHTARSVTVTFDSNQTSVPAIIERLCRLGVIGLGLVDPMEWAETLAEEVIPQAEDPTTLPGRLNRQLLLASGGAIDLFRLTVALLVFTAGVQVRRALLRGDAIPWLRVLTYLLAAASLWTARKQKAVDGRQQPVATP